MRQEEEESIQLVFQTTISPASIRQNDATWIVKRWQETEKSHHSPVRRKWWWGKKRDDDQCNDVRRGEEKRRSIDCTHTDIQTERREKWKLFCQKTGNHFSFLSFSLTSQPLLEYMEENCKIVSQSEATTKEPQHTERGSDGLKRRQRDDEFSTRPFVHPHLPFWQKEERFKKKRDLSTGKEKSDAACGTRKEGNEGK